MTTTEENKSFVWEEKNSIEPLMKSENNGTIVPNDIIGEIKNKFVNKECVDIGNKNLWKKNCPKCNREQFYSHKRSLNYVIKKNYLCVFCSQVGKHHKSEEWKNRHSELRKGKPNGRLGTHLSEETKLKISKSHIGIPSSNKGKSNA